MISDLPGFVTFVPVRLTVALPEPPQARLEGAEIALVGAGDDSVEVVVSRRTSKACPRPAAAIDTRASPGIGAGFGRYGKVSPVPSCPLSLIPHDQSAPSLASR
jgi:hypothetical protein